MSHVFSVCLACGERMSNVTSYTLAYAKLFWTLNWWKGKPSGSIACTRKQQPRFYWSCSSVVMNDATPLYVQYPITFCVKQRTPTYVSVFEKYTAYGYRTPNVYLRMRAYEQTLVSADDICCRVTTHCTFAFISLIHFEVFRSNLITRGVTSIYVSVS